MIQSDLASLPDHSIEKFRTFETMKELIEFTQAGAYDWINEPMGPRRYWDMGRYAYDICKKIIQEKEIAVTIDINNNYWEEIDILKRILEEKGAKIVEQYDA